MLTEKERRLAEQLSFFIERLDGIIFPENAIEVFVLTHPPPNESERFRYCSQTPSFIPNYEGELYLIFGGGLVERIKEEQQKKIILFSKQEIEKETNDLLFLSLEEVLIALAVHEVRHRIQHHYPERIFSSRDAERINNAYLKRLFIYITLLCEQISPDTFKEEFDASLVEHWAIEEWHWGQRDFNRIAWIVKSEESLLNKIKLELIISVSFFKKEL